jgi:hypothetical protein
VGLPSAPAGVQQRRPDPFGLGAPAPQGAPQQRQGQAISIEDSLPEPSGAEEIAIDDVPTTPRAVATRPATPAADGGEAQLREALSKASREVIEKIAWEVVPQLAETIIREELDRLIKDRETQH